MSKAWPWPCAAVPQQHVKGFGWIECAEHKATRWSAFIKDKLLGRYATKAEALEAIRVAKARRAPLPRAYRLGSRMPKQSARD